MEKVVRDWRSVTDRFLEEAPFVLPASVPWFENDAGVMLQTVDRFTTCSAALQLAAESLNQTHVLAFVVERGDHHVAAFVTLWIVGVPADDMTPDAVIVRVDCCHMTSVPDGGTLQQEVRLSPG